MIFSRNSLWLVKNIKIMLFSFHISFFQVETIHTSFPASTTQNKSSLFYFYGFTLLNLSSD